jgi:hypothetical protein
MCSNCFRNQFENSSKSIRTCRKQFEHISKTVRKHFENMSKTFRMFSNVFQMCDASCIHCALLFHSTGTELVKLLPIKLQAAATQTAAAHVALQRAQPFSDQRHLEHPNFVVPDAVLLFLSLPHVFGATLAGAASGFLPLPDAVAEAFAAAFALSGLRICFFVDKPPSLFAVAFSFFFSLHLLSNISIMSPISCAALPEASSWAGASAGVVGASDGDATDNALYGVPGGGRSG